MSFNTQAETLVCLKRTEYLLEEILCQMIRAKDPNDLETVNVEVNIALKNVAHRLKEYSEQTLGG